MRNRFEEQLELLNKELTTMGALCENVISLTAQALEAGDSVLAHQVMETDREIDEMEKEIEALCMKLLLRQQPVAKDLRHISSALKMITDMERIGDQASGISDIIATTHIASAHDTYHVGEMAKATMKMVTDSVEAFVRQDQVLAEQVLAYDDVVDNLFEEVKKSLINLIHLSPEEGETAIDLLLIAKYFERIGDHATNIAEWVLFSITGIHKEG